MTVVIDATTGHVTDWSLNSNTAATALTALGTPTTLA